MIIKGKSVVIFDIECFPNVFSCVAKNTETNEIKTFEISDRKNDVKDLICFFRDTKLLFCGYNNIHYDNPIINFILDNSNTMPNDVKAITNKLFQLSNIIISESNFDYWKKYKYDNNFATMDLLTLLFSSKLRIGLKEMQVTMQYSNVREYEGDFTKCLPIEEIDNMLSYNLNDVLSTEVLLNKVKPDIDLRLGIEEEFGIDVLSKDGMTIGTEILKTKYLEKTGKQWFEIKDLRSPCDFINLNDVILPFIKFETPVLQDLLKEMKQQKVSPGRKGYEKHFLLDNVEVTVGVGGIHTKNDPESIIPKDNELLLDSDVNSLYPSLIISYGIVPKHLGKEFLDIYGEIREDRLNAKRNKKEIKNKTLKLALNGATGNYQNEYSWLYDPIAVMRIRINGQLLLLLLAEKLIKVGAHIKQLNTDGILYTIPKDIDYQAILKEWEDETKLTLETEEYEAFYQFAINDYLAVGKGYSETKDKSLLKMKGLFIDKVSLGKGMQPLIIPKAINEYLANGTLPEKTIYASRDINDFLTYTKVDKKFSVEYNGKLISRINRYYASTNGCFLYRCMKVTDDTVVPMIKVTYENGESEVLAKQLFDTNDPMLLTKNIISVESAEPKIIPGKRDKYANLLKASGVTIVNNLEEISEFPTNINYKYYITECYKIINPLKTVQLSLF